MIDFSGFLVILETSPLIHQHHQPLMTAFHHPGHGMRIEIYQQIPLIYARIQPILYFEH